MNEVYFYFLLLVLLVGGLSIAVGLYALHLKEKGKSKTQKG